MMAEPATSGSASPKHKADAIDSLVSGPLPAAAAKLAGCSRRIPSGKDFHFYNNFDEFKSPVKEIRQRSETLLRSIAASDGLWGSRQPSQLPEDIDDACEWLSNLNDEFVERLSISMDEFKTLREKEEDGSKQVMEMEMDGFQLVNGKKKKGSSRQNSQDEGFSGLTSSMAVNVAMKDKKTTVPRSKVPFHIPSIPRPQDEYSILVNNNNQPFDHVWLEKNEDGSGYIHPLEKLSVLDFVDRSVSEADPVKPLPLEMTPFKLVEGVNDLKELAIKLRNVSEFAVDLEHNQYRSFQGLTCLMQISTRTEDFVIDTLKLRIHVGPYLREVFKDPLKRKIMHGADRDIIWLQRDFGIYACNLFDTGQASRVLQLERNSLEYLLHYFCGVTANKEYQNADWRLRPVPVEMIKYSREDTHYLLHVYDLMRRMLLSASSDDNDLLAEVYRRSAEICMQLYEKELLTENSYLHIYGLMEAGFNSQQLAVVSGLCQWRDSIARVEDESTGYILPNKALLEIARQMPLTAGKLKRLVKYKHPYVERYLSSVLSTIKNAIEKSAAFESIAEHLKKGRVETPQSRNMEVDENSEPVPADDRQTSQPVVGNSNLGIVSSVEPTQVFSASVDVSVKTVVDPQQTKVPVCTRSEQETIARNVPFSDAGGSSNKSDTYGAVDKQHLNSESSDQLQSRQGSITSVEILRKPTRAFGALFGKSSSLRKTTPYAGSNINQDNIVNKVEQIKSNVALPFFYFSGEKVSDSNTATAITNAQAETLEDHPTSTAETEEIIMLDEEGDEAESLSDSAMEDDGVKQGDIQPESHCAREQTSTDEHFKPIMERCEHDRKPSRPEISFEVKPFDYTAARKAMNFGAGKDKSKGKDDQETSTDSRCMLNNSVPGQAHGEERSRGSQGPRRRQAFPASGNRSMTYH